jgi:hypothetical protein
MAQPINTLVGCLCIYNTRLDSAAIAVLERFRVGFERRSKHGDIWFEVAAITAQQYDAVIEALSDLGEPGIDWDFTLE